MNEDHADELEAREKAGVDAPVEGMLSAARREELYNHIDSTPASDKHLDAIMVSHNACERALRDSRNLLREAEARGDEWKRVANEREEALREAQAKLQTTRKNALEEAALIVDGCNLRGPYDAIRAAKLIRELYGYGSELREALAQQPPQAGGEEKPHQ